MRARLRGLVVVAFVVVSMPVLFLVCLLPMLLTGKGDFSIWMARVVWSPSVLWLAGARLEIERLAPLPAGPAIYISNHESALDIFSLFAALPRNLRFLAKRELFRIPIFGWYLAMARFIPVDRMNHARAVASLKRAGAAIRNGISLIAFPEGTRSPDRRVHAFKKGPFVVALEAGVPVVPVAIVGSGAVSPKDRIAVEPGSIRVLTGEPVDPLRFPDRNLLLGEVRRRVIELHRSAGGLGGDVEDDVAPVEAFREAADS